jgi:RNA polymerase sigma-70 factor (ECF subfamily)
MLTDKEIIGKVISGNIPAFSAIVSRYQTPVYSLAIRVLRNEEDAEEVASDVFLKVFRSLDTFRMDSKFSTWLFAIAYNSAISRLRKRKSRKKDAEIYSFDEDNIDYSNLADINNSIESIETAERRKFINEAIKQLEPDEAAIINMFYFDGLRIAEICEVTGLKKSNVKIKLHRSRKKLSVFLSKALKNELDLL